jgi:tRNA(Arg) A34 adenosine deaminase TadA
MDEKDNELLVEAFGVARRARDKGNHPFGALLADATGNVLLEAENTVVTEGDCTGHAETNLARKASIALTEQQLATCTLFTSAEPCAMCAGAIYWSGIGRVVYGLSEAQLLRLTGGDAENPTMTMGIREVLASGQRDIVVDGPRLEDRAAEVHEGFWDPARVTKVSDARPKS